MTSAPVRKEEDRFIRERPLISLKNTTAVKNRNPRGAESDKRRRSVDAAALELQRKNFAVIKLLLGVQGENLNRTLGSPTAVEGESVREGGYRDRPS